MPRPNPLRYILLSLVGAACLAAQPPVVGTIDFYGVHRVPRDRIRKALGISEGERLTRPRGDLEEAVEKASGVVHANVEAQCCENGKVVLYVGVEEKGGPHLELHDEPAADLSLPPEIVSAYHDYLQAFARAEDKSEDFRYGHPLASDVNTRVIQERFIGLADIYREHLRRVVRNAEDSELRAAAACVLGYASAKKLVVDDLQYAMRDPEASVRLNAMRSLTAIAVLAREAPELDIRVTPTWFIESLHSLEWKARYQASLSLDALTEDRQPKVLEQIRDNGGLRPLTEMAAWKSLSHALPAYMVLGRVAGFDEKKILELWALGRRQEVIDKARKMAR